MKVLPDKKSLCVDTLRAKCEVVVLVGIGGSYLGSRAVIDALSSSFDWLQKERKSPVILYAGNNIGEDYLAELTEYLQGKSFGIINISKSGTTTEPALAFRILKSEHARCRSLRRDCLRTPPCSYPAWMQR